jgi:hypothetical protein
MLFVYVVSSQQVNQGNVTLNITEQIPASSSLTLEQILSALDDEPLDAGVRDDGSAPKAISLPTTIESKNVIHPTAPTNVNTKCQGLEFLVGSSCRSCESIIKESMDAMRNAKLQFMSGCTVDDDCFLEPTSNNCYGDCPVAILRSKTQAWNDLKQNLNEGICKDFSKFCAYNTPMCIAMTPSCQKGNCIVTENVTSVTFQ